MSLLSKESPAKPNPYVGPRPFRAGDRLFGRDREAREVVDLLVAERILLVHAPSGAGKTSLLQAKVIPELEKRFTVSGPLRVNAVPIDGAAPRNRYAWSLVVGLTGGDGAGSTDFLDMTLTEFLDSEHDPHAGASHRALVIDQFEEILTLDPGDRQKQTDFFRDLGRALRNTDRWALFSMREDYMGGLAPFLGYLPTNLRVRYRIDFLSHRAAREAAKRPAKENGVHVGDEAADALVNDLAKVRVQRPGEQRAETVDGPYVEPVQLQVVLTELWSSLTERWGGSLENICLSDIEEYGDFDKALAGFYAKTVRSVARRTGASKRMIRDWFERELITEDGFRNQTRTGPDVGDPELRAIVLEGLAERYLIRSEQRGAITWYELAHDRLIDPICTDNARWREEHLDRWEIAAETWERAGRPQDLLLDAISLELAEHQSGEHRSAVPVLQEYLKTSAERVESERDAARREALLRGTSAVATVLWIIVIVETAFLVYLLAV